MKTSVVGSGGPTGLDEQLIFTLFIQVGSVWSVLLHDDEDYTTSVTVFSDRDPGVTAGLILGVLKPVGPHTQSICYVGFFFFCLFGCFCFCFFNGQTFSGTKMSLRTALPGNERNADHVSQQLRRHMFFTFSHRSEYQSYLPLETSKEPQYPSGP